MLCLPCSKAAAATDSDDNYTSEADAKGTNDGGVLDKPTVAEYVGEVALEFLNVLEAVAQEIPVPGVDVAVKIAANLIKICEASQATLEKAEELKIRTKMLVTVVVNELKEKKAEEINGKLKDDINVLQRELKHIEEKLNEIASQHKALLVFFRRMNEGKVQNCMDRLDILLERFTIARHVEHAHVLNRLEKEIIGFYNAQKKTLDHIQDVMADVNVTMKDVRAMMKAAPVASSSCSPDTRAHIPANTGLFYGRDALVFALAAHLANTSDGQKQHHTCILGPGGMGKTSTALAVIAHPDVKKHYTESNLIWVPCVKATSVSLLLDTLYSSLGITQMKGNINDNILSVLRSSGPLILLFDNFETPWNTNGGRSATERILGEIGQIPHITLVVTMRSSTPPCKGLVWHSVDLQAVDADAARRIYCEIHPDGKTDPQLPALLDLVGNMPLAITLMATTASLTGLSAEGLVEQYKVVGPTLLSQGSDAENSMDICISLSVDSPPMKRSREAQWLLAALAALPIGATFAMLSKWWAHRLSNPAGALQVLRETSLVQRQGLTFYILPVVQRYVLDPARFDADVRASLVDSACKYVDYYTSSPGDEHYKQYSEILAIEASNLESILLQSTNPSVDIINALLTLARYQTSTRPRTNVIQHALGLVLRMKNNNRLHAAILLCYGHICHALNRYEEARKHFLDARELFLSVSDVNQAAECLFGCMDAYFYQSIPIGEAISLVSQAQSELQSIGNERGVAQCWFYHGHVISRSDPPSALELLHRAYDKSSEFGDLVLSARCSASIAWAYYCMGEMEQAEIWVTIANEGSNRIGPSERALERQLMQGCILNARGQYAVALKVFVQCLEQSKAFEAPLHMGLALVDMGISWMKMGKKEDARGAFQDALGVFPSVPGREDHDACRYMLRKVDEPNTVPTPSEDRAVSWDFPIRVRQLLGL